jgi:hypothetical protein
MRTAREIMEALAASPLSVTMDELQHVSHLGGKYAPVANAEIARRDGPVRDSITDFAPWRQS